jgi:hypothetical protein
MFNKFLKGGLNYENLSENQWEFTSFHSVFVE